MLFGCKFAQEWQQLLCWHTWGSVLMLSPWHHCMAWAEGQTPSLCFGTGPQGTDEHFNSQGIACGKRKPAGNGKIALFLYPVPSSTARSPVRVSQRLPRSVKLSWGTSTLAALGHVLQEAHFPFRAAGRKLKRTTGPVTEHLSCVTAKSRKRGAERASALWILRTQILQEEAELCLVVPFRGASLQRLCLQS